MSEVYVLEPPTHGKVILATTHGNLDVELWAKECPKASRNFVQLCMDGYYDNAPFHRVIKDFIIQGGDPTGTGQGGLSIYGETPFPLEIHPRLKFRYRGLVALAALETSAPHPAANRHGSQFFMTLGRADCLNGKHTIFGKITGHSLYNLLSIADVPVDSKTDRPLDPLPRILSTEVLYSPFDDLHPRPGFKEQSERTNIKETEKSKGGRETLQTKKYNLLSFEEDEVEVVSVTTRLESPHDVKDGVSPMISSTSGDNGSNLKPAQIGEPQLESLRKLKERVAAKTNRINRGEDQPAIDHHEDKESVGVSGTDEEGPSSSNNSDEDGGETELIKTTEQRRKNAEEIDTLRKEILAFKKGEGSSKKDERESDRISDADLLTEAEKRRRWLVNKSRQPEKRRRGEQTLTRISEFTKRLREATTGRSAEGEGAEIGKQSALTATVADPVPADDDDEIRDWLVGEGLKFAVDSARAYELDAANDTLISIDPLANRNKSKETKTTRNKRSKNE